MLCLFHQAVLRIVFEGTTLDSKVLLEAAAQVEKGVKIDSSVPAFCVHSFVRSRKVSLEILLCGALVVMNHFVSSALGGFVRCRYTL